MIKLFSTFAMKNLILYPIMILIVFMIKIMIKQNKNEKRRS